MTACERIEVFKGKRSGQWFWRHVAKNGQTRSVSEAYTRERDAVRAARAAMRRPPTGLFKSLPPDGRLLPL